MKKTVYSSILLVALISCKGSKEKTEDVTIDSSAKAVTVVEVKEMQTSRDFRYSGTVVAGRTIPLSFQTTGTVESVLVEMGDAVTKGQLLATVEKSNSQNMYDMAQAKYQQAKDAYDRLKTVHDKGSLPEIKWVEMETNFEQAKSSLAMSKENLSKCNLYAPCSGIVGKRNSEPGMSALALTGAPIAFVEINEVYVKISVPESEVGKIRKGQKAQFIVSALENKLYSGKITNINPVADIISRTYEAKIQVENKNIELKPGMVCDVNFTQTDGKSSLLIPYQAVSKDADGKSFVFIVNKNSMHVKKQIVETGTYNGDNLEILSGLKNGETIVREGREKLSDNDLISL